MSKTLKLSLITPQKQLLDGLAVESVVLPALQGEMGVLPGHIPMMVQLDFGSLRYKQDGQEKEFAVLGGFAEVLHEAVNVFAEGADLAEEIDEEAEKQKIKRAKESLSSKDADIDFELAELELKQAIARMKVKKHRLG
ncbi:ATP synthase F1 subunit epsilon [Candidatus Avelusimicrobium facis]|uniref:ATP synthase F1 subunit epsilon n=1 Tax=Candidatus Avelusimicrobium facis TaxID=3416203 RepID=UPI0015B51F96